MELTVLPAGISSGSVSSRLAQNLYVAQAGSESLMLLLQSPGFSELGKDLEPPGTSQPPSRPPPALVGAPRCPHPGTAPPSSEPFNRLQRFYFYLQENSIIDHDLYISSQAHVGQARVRKAYACALKVITHTGTAARREEAEWGEGEEEGGEEQRGGGRKAEG